MLSSVKDIVALRPEDFRISNLINRIETVTPFGHNLSTTVKAVIYGTTFTVG
jgi:hypothetical protein